MFERTVFESEFVWFVCPFGGSTINDHHIWYLLQLNIESVSFSFYIVEVAMPD